MQIVFHNKVVFLVLFLFSTSIAIAQTKYLQADTTVQTQVLGNSTIYSNKSLTENLSTTTNYSIVSEALVTSEMSKELDKLQMFTFFAPDNAAFSHYSEKELEALFSDKKGLRDILNLHVIPGRVDRNSIERMIEFNKGVVNFKTLGGQNLIFKKEGDDIFISSEAGIKGKVVQTNYLHKNGFFHGISVILLPE